MANLWPEREREKGSERETKTNVYYFKFRVDQFYCARNWAKVCTYRTGGEWGVSAPFCRGPHGASINFYDAPANVAAAKKYKNVCDACNMHVANFGCSSPSPPHPSTQIAICSRTERKQ